MQNERDAGEVLVTQAEHERAAEIMKQFGWLGTRMHGGSDYQYLLRALAEHRIATRPPAPEDAGTVERAFQLGDRVEKKSGSSWNGVIVGSYSTALTPEGYAVESEREPGSVQIYPAKALRLAALSRLDGEKGA